MHAKSVAVLAYSFAPSKARAGHGQGIVHIRLPCRVPGPELQYRRVNPTADVQQMSAEERRHDLLVHGGERQPGLPAVDAPVRAEDTHSVWLNGYSKSVINANPTLMNGVLFGDQHVPFEAETQFPGAYPGLQQYFTEMQKY